MKLTVMGHELPATVVSENGKDTGYAPVLAILQRLGVPLKIGEDGALLAGIGALAGYLTLPKGYDTAANTFWIGEKPLPVLPAEPVGADTNPAHLPDIPIRSEVGKRDPKLLDLVIRQFHVAENPALLIRDINGDSDPETFCNIFMWWWSVAMGAEIAHWRKDDGTMAKAAEPGTWEINANDTIAWLRRYGSAYGWQPTRSGPALYAANQGKPAVVCWYNPGRIGHVAVLRPGAMDPAKGVPIAQAGVSNFDDGYLADGFGYSQMDAVEYFVHD